MEKILIGLLIVVAALLLYFIGPGKKTTQNNGAAEDPLAGLPDIIGRPKGVTTYRGADTTASPGKGKIAKESRTIEDNDNQNDRVSIDQPEAAAKVVPDWKEEEEEMGRYVPDYIDEGFATGITFDELELIENLLERQSHDPSDKKATLHLVSKIDGTQLLGLLESRIDDASKKIALLFDRLTVEQGDDDPTLHGENNDDGFIIGDYV